MTDSNQFAPTCSPRMLIERARLLKSLRAFFDERGFVEVQTPVLGSESVIDAHIDPIKVNRSEISQATLDQAQAWYLQTSPELMMKRLLACGMHSIYQIGSVFRGGEAGARHNPEFTMAEWYRCGDDLERGVQLLGDLAQSVLQCSQPKVMTYRNAFKQVLQINPIECDEHELDLLLERDGDRIPRGLDRDGKLEWLFGERIQPTFKGPSPVIVTHYPLSQGALAQQSKTEQGTAERFELFFEGVELANGYGELRDADELIERFERQNKIRGARGAPLIPLPQKLLASMRHGLPHCTGCALGLERLLMVMFPGTLIEDVMPFPFARV